MNTLGYTSDDTSDSDMTDSEPVSTLTEYSSDDSSDFGGDEEEEQEKNETENILGFQSTDSPRQKKSKLNKLLKKYHPDKCKGSDCEKNWNRVRSAWEKHLNLNQDSSSQQSEALTSDSDMSDSEPKPISSLMENSDSNSDNKSDKEEEDDQEKSDVENILGFESTDSPRQKKSKYNQLVKKYHPDKCKAEDCIQNWNRVRSAWEKYLGQDSELSERSSSPIQLQSDDTMTDVDEEPETEEDKKEPETEEDKEEPETEEDKEEPETEEDKEEPETEEDKEDTVPRTEIVPVKNFPIIPKLVETKVYTTGKESKENLTLKLKKAMKKAEKIIPEQLTSESPSVKKVTSELKKKAFFNNEAVQPLLDEITAIKTALDLNKGVEIDQSVLEKYMYEEADKMEELNTTLSQLTETILGLKIWKVHDNSDIGTSVDTTRFLDVQKKLNSYDLLTDALRKEMDDFRAVQDQTDIFDENQNVHSRAAMVQDLRKKWNEFSDQLNELREKTALVDKTFQKDLYREKIWLVDQSKHLETEKKAIQAWKEPDQKELKKVLNTVEKFRETETKLMVYKNILSARPVKLNKVLADVKRHQKTHQVNLAKLETRLSEKFRAKMDQFNNDMRKLGERKAMCKKTQSKNRDINLKLMTLESELELNDDKLRSVEQSFETEVSSVTGGSSGGFVFPKITDPVTVQIYKYHPYTPKTNLEDIEQLQLELFQNWPGLAWNVGPAPDTNECMSTTQTLSKAQEIAVHYFNPFNARNQQGMLLNHSAGSGKSATAALVASTWVRQDPKRIVIWVTKSGLNHLGQEGIEKESDFNVQQYTQGMPLVEKVHSDLKKYFVQFAEAENLTEEEADFLAVQCMVDMGEKLLPDRHKYFNRMRSTSKNRKEGTSETVAVPRNTRNPNWRPCDYFIELTKKKSRAEIEKLSAATYDESPLETANKKSLLQGAVIFTEQKVLEAGMGVQWKFMEYNQFAKLAGENCDRINKDNISEKPKPTSVWLDYLHQGVNKDTDRSEDILRDCLVVIDEAHLLTVPEKVAGNVTESGCLLKRFLNLSYSSARLSKPENACKWLLLTATSVVESPLDLIGLLMLLNPVEVAEQYDFLEYIDIGIGKDGTGEVSNRTKDKFIEDSVVEDQYGNQVQLKSKVLRGMQELVFGKVSALNSSGDPGHFADPEVQFPKVQLSINQVSEIFNVCLSNKPSLDGMKIYNYKFGKILERVSRQEFRYDEGQVMRRVKGKPKKASNPATFTLPSCLQSVAMVASEIKQGETSTTSKSKGAAKNSVVKMASLVNQNKSLPNDAEKFIQTNLPMLYSITQNVFRDRQFSRKYYDSIGSNLMYGKQIIHLDLKTHNDTLGSKLMTYLLTNQNIKYGKYVRLNKYFTASDGPGKNVTPENFIQDNGVQDYRGIIVLDGGLHKSQYEKYKQACINYFNSKDNIDGRKCYLLVNTYRFREGISVRDVMYMHMAGYFTSHAYLVQAAFRGIRNCSQRDLPYSRGWKIFVRMYNPVFPDAEGHSEVSAMDVAKVLDKKTRTKQYLVDNTEKFMFNHAADKLLLQGINTQSAAILNRLQFPPPNLN